MDSRVIFCLVLLLNRRLQRCQEAEKRDVKEAEKRDVKKQRREM